METRTIILTPEEKVRVKGLIKDLKETLGHVEYLIRSEYDLNESVKQTEKRDNIIFMIAGLDCLLKTPEVNVKI